ncbi:TIGR02147 family protein [Bdellovibrio bacteriovorus]|uniref:TIGR02147 family protein n=1 Tax=Bdellovibrio bacteriovorus TaxID=959 RepID=UPI0035A6F3C4
MTSNKVMTSSVALTIKESMAPHLILKRIIKEKQSHNPRVSLRRIAARMGISSGRLSEILSQKRPLTAYYADKFCAALNLPESDVNELKTSMAKPLDKQAFGPILEEHIVEKLADWKPYALLSFLQTIIYSSIRHQNSTSEAQVLEISKRMNLPSAEITVLLGALEQAGLAKWDGDGWRPTHQEATTGYDIPSHARMQGLIADLHLAQEKIKNLNVHERDFSSMTLTMDPKDIHKAKKLIRDFRRNFVRIMEKGSKKSVHQISIQFFPIVSSDTPSKESL